MIPRLWNQIAQVQILSHTCCVTRGHLTSSCFSFLIYKQTALTLQHCCCDSVAQPSPTLCDPMDCSTPDFPVHHQLPEFTQTHVHWVGDAIQPSHPLSVPFSSCTQSLPASGSFPVSQLFTSGGQSFGVFSFSIRLSNEHPGLISFRMDWLDLLAVQATLMSLLQYHSSKASILLCSAFFTVQLSHPYMTTGKTIALTRPSFVDKVMSLLFNM